MCMNISLATFLGGGDQAEKGRERAGAGLITQLTRGGARFLSDRAALLPVPISSILLLERLAQRSGLLGDYIALLLGRFALPHSAYQVSQPLRHFS